jgi:hypothetical protein
MIDGLAHGFDALALDQNFAGLEQGSSINLEQPRGVEDDGRRGRIRRGLLGGRQGSCGKKYRRQNEGCAKLGKEFPHGYDYAAVAPGLSMKKFTKPGLRRPS